MYNNGSITINLAQKSLNNNYMRAERDHMSTLANLKTSSCVHPINPICSKCKAENFSENESERQEKVLKVFGELPPDCVSSSIDGPKCPFVTGKAYKYGARLHKIS